MKIVIKDKDREKPIRISAPLSLVTISLRVLKPFIYYSAKKEKDKDLKRVLDCIDFNLLCKSIKELKHFNGLNIVEVKEKGGTEIRITV